jgi:hypothetical protein
MLLHRLSGTFPSLTTAACCPSAAGCPIGMRSLATHDVGQVGPVGKDDRRPLQTNLRGTRPLEGLDDSGPSRWRHVQVTTEPDDRRVSQGAAIPTLQALGLSGDPPKDFAAWSTNLYECEDLGWSMPGWYVHMETAKQMVDRLRAGDVPPDFPGGPQAASQLGEIAHTWRNYLAVGALGPDLFFLLPDFKRWSGCLATRPSSIRSHATVVLNGAATREVLLLDAS